MGLHHIKYKRATQIRRVGDEIPMDVVLTSCPIQAICICGWEGKVFVSSDGGAQKLARQDGKHHLAR